MGTQYTLRNNNSKLNKEHDYERLLNICLNKIKDRDREVTDR